MRVGRCGGACGHVDSWPVHHPHLHITLSDDEVEEKNLQQPTALDFSDLSHPHESKNIQRSLKFLKASTEVSAQVIEDPLESSVELGVDVAMSNSQNDNKGEQLMAQHVGGLVGGAMGGAGLVHSSGGLQMGGQRSAFFKPISRLSLETDEQKLSKDRLHPIFKPTPTPRIFVNESELQLSPLSPPPPLGHYGQPHSGVFLP